MRWTAVAVPKLGIPPMHIETTPAGERAVHGDRSGLVKIVGDARTGEVIGAYIVDTRATEMIQELVNLRDLQGGYAELARIPHGHPTMSEAIVEATRAANGWLVHG